MSRWKQRIAVLGGGMGAMAAAFELTEFDPRHELYEITIYQRGWRLGGKGAVGRVTADGNRALEHGLHVWAGFYDSAFGILRRAYAAIRDEMNELPPFGDWSGAFTRIDHITLLDDDWRPWPIPFSFNAGAPGMSTAPTARPAELLLPLLRGTLPLLQNARALGEGAGIWSKGVKATAVDRIMLKAFDEAREALEAAPMQLEDAIVRVRAMTREPWLAQKGALIDLASPLKTLTSRIGKAVTVLCQQRAEARQVSRVRDLERTWILLNIALALIAGIVTDDVLFEGFDRLDDEDWRDWMQRHGCSAQALQSAPVRSCYDYVFGYAAGRPNFGAGTGSHALLRFLFDYEGAPMFAPNAPLGDVLFAPLYRILKARGVIFKFCHRIGSLAASADGGTIAKVAYAVQAEVVEDFNPLIAIKGHDGIELYSWPASPDLNQIDIGLNKNPTLMEVEGADWRDAATGELVHRSIADGVESDQVFDVAILGIGFGALPSICEDLAGKLPAWKAMFNQVKTTRTVAAQVWGIGPVNEMCPWAARGEIASGFPLMDNPRLETWADNSVFLNFELDPRYQSLAYFVGTLPDDASARTTIPRASKDAKAADGPLDPWFADALDALWRNLGKWPDPGRFGVYQRVNDNPSDRYVQSVAGSLAARMTADGSGVTGLYLAGDWVRTGLNAGCMEAAAMAGRLAVKAMTGEPMNVRGSNQFDLPNLPFPFLPIINVINRAGRLLFGGVGSMDSCCVIRWVEKQNLQPLLPRDLRLPDPPYAPPPLDLHSSAPRHPVIFMFSRMTDVKPGAMPLPGISYDELSCIIPYVAVAGANDGNYFNFSPYMLLDDPLAVALGVQIYAFNKQLARFRVSDGSFDIKSDHGEISADFHGVSAPGDPSTFDPNAWNWLRTILDIPLISRTKEGKTLFSRLDLHLDSATVQKVAGSIRFNPGFLPREGNQEILVEDICHTFDRHPKAFRLVANWDLTLPVEGPTGATTRADSATTQTLTRSLLRTFVNRFPFDHR